MSRLLILALVPLFAGCCYLDVQTKPSGAMVAVDDVYIGDSPVKGHKIWFWQTFSWKRITAAKEGYAPGEAEIGFWEVFFWLWGTTKERVINLSPAKTSDGAVHLKPDPTER
ncbi:MAG: hypothetical protein E3J72_05665 [Planctomycetota bacterium]|nr:MAG: hypothetical protein E3J72_05665 [Planctomycetota bacterium]